MSFIEGGVAGGGVVIVAGLQAWLHIGDRGRHGMGGMCDVFVLGCWGSSTWCTGRGESRCIRHGD